MEIKLTMTDPKFKLGDLVYDRMTHRNFTVTWIAVTVNFYIGNHVDKSRIEYVYHGTDERKGYVTRGTLQFHLILASEITSPKVEVEVSDE